MAALYKDCNRSCIFRRLLHFAKRNSHFALLSTALVGVVDTSLENQSLMSSNTRCMCVELELHEQFQDLNEDVMWRGGLLVV